MTVQQAIITLVAAIISGILATIITISINAYLADIKRKQDLVDDIFGFKYQLTDGDATNKDIYAKGFSRAMNRVPIIFYKNKNVVFIKGRAGMEDYYEVKGYRIDSTGY